jgi:hypothetical protein
MVIITHLVKTKIPMEEKEEAETATKRRRRLVVVDFSLVNRPFF